MGPKRKKQDGRTKLKDAVDKLVRGLTKECHLLQEGSCWHMHLAASLDESVAFLKDVQEDLDLWDGTQMTEQCLQDFSRLDLSASIYLLRRHYYELKETEAGEPFL